jgi:bacterial/archaeal transporter family-2 protein
MIYCILAFIAGIALPIQVGVNSALRRGLGHPLMATLVNFVIGGLGLALYLVLARASFPSRAAMAAAPAWAWPGGLLGALYVSTTVVAGPRLGSATLLACVILGQLLTSLVMITTVGSGFHNTRFPRHASSARCSHSAVYG